jgi:ATP-dependent DNA helicase RecG
LEQGLPEPLFEIKSGSLVVTLRKYKFTESVKSELNKRQQKAIDYLLKEENKITNMKYRQLNPEIKRDTAKKDLKALVDKGILSAKGKGRYAYYVLA